MTVVATPSLTNSASWRWPTVLLCLAIVHLSQAAWAAVDHQSFAQVLVPGQAGSGHLVHDYAAASATFGLLFLAAARLPQWRVPALAAGTTWTALHGISHVVAATSSGTAAAVAEALLLAVAALFLAVLWRAARPMA